MAESSDDGPPPRRPVRSGGEFLLAVAAALPLVVWVLGIATRRLSTARSLHGLYIFGRANSPLASPALLANGLALVILTLVVWARSDRHGVPSMGVVALLLAFSLFGEVFPGLPADDFRGASHWLGIVWDGVFLVGFAALVLLVSAIVVRVTTGDR